MSSEVMQARQPCLQKPLPSAKVSATTARAKGDAPLTPSAARLPAQALGQGPAAGWTRAMPTRNHRERTHGKTGQI